MRSPSDNIAADMADTRSSSVVAGKSEAIVKPSTLTTADASMSGLEARILRKRSMMSWVRVFWSAITLLSLGQSLSTAGAIEFRPQG
jgi:hypothetical protein